ncbi:C2 domain-containing protein At1g53590 [Linum perenne]
MDWAEMSIMYHVGFVLFLLWLLSCFAQIHPFAYFFSLIYLYMVHDRYITKLRKKLQYEEAKQANQKRIAINLVGGFLSHFHQVLSDSETVRWLNHVVEKMWPLCMEEITSQKILLPIIPWFLEKYKPWTAKKAVVQHLYMGRNPPVFTEMRVLRQCTGDDHLALEMGLRFCTADDMSAILAIKLRRRLGFGMWTKLHITGMQVEGKVLIGIKFLRRWPFIGRLRVCFAEPPYFQMTVKPIFTHGVDVTVLPGIAGWLDKLLSMAFEQTLVQPNMLVVDLEKLVSPTEESWFCVDEKKPIAFAKVEVIEASDMKPSDLNGLADPYVKGKLGPYGFRTKTQKKTLTPKWLEEFEIPIITWDPPNLLVVEVRDKDHFVDDSLGNCTVNISDLRDGERHDMWLPLQNIKIGRLHLAITVHKEKEDIPCSIEGDALDKQEVQQQQSFASDTPNRSSFSSATSDVSQKVADDLEPINLEGQQDTGVWIHRPGNEVPQIWVPRKGKTRQVGKTLGDSFGSSVLPGVQCDDSSSSDEATEGKKSGNRVRRGLRKITSAFHRNPKEGSNLKEDTISEESVESPYANIRAANQREGGVKFIVEDSLSGPLHGKDSKPLNSSPESTNSAESPGKGDKKHMPQRFLNHMEKSARNLKHVLSRKGSRLSRGVPQGGPELEIDPEFDSSDDDDNDESVPTGVPTAVEDPVIPGDRSGTGPTVGVVKSEEQSNNGEGTKEIDSEESLKPIEVSAEGNMDEKER